MKNKKILLGLTALLSIGVASTLASCAVDNRIQVVFWHTMGKANQEKLNAMIETFEAAHPDIHINHEQQGGYTDIESKIRKAIPARTVPTMAFCYADHVAGYGSNTVDMTPYINDPEIGLSAEELADYIPGYWSEGSEYIREGFYSAPYSKSTEVIFYNKTFFEEHDLPLPTKWESDDPNDLTAMWNLCRKIKEIATGEGIADVVPLGYDSDDNMYITLSAQYGIPYTSVVDGKGSFDFNNDEAKALVKRLKGYYDEGLFKTKGTLPNQQFTSTLFKNQKLFMSIGSTGGTSYNIPLKDSDGIYDFDAGVAMLPQQNPERSYIISQGPSICFFRNSKISEEQVRASWLFYKHITTPENSAMYSILTGYEPVRTSSYETEEYKAHLAKLGTDKETLYTRVASLTSTPAVREAYFSSPAFQGSSTARQQCGGIITLVMYEDATKVNIDEKIDEIFEDAAEECRIAAL